MSDRWPTNFRLMMELNFVRCSTGLREFDMLDPMMWIIMMEVMEERKESLDSELE